MSSQRISPRLASCLVFLTVLLASGTIAAQTIVSGKVTDTQGSDLADVAVALTSTPTGATISAKTDASGVYSIGNVPPGEASLTFKQDGFVTLTVPGLIVNPGKQLTRDVRLTPAVDYLQYHPTLAQAVFNPGSEATAADFVMVATNAVAGPLGYASTPSLGSAVQSLSAQQQALAAGQQYNFPSIIFYISAAPVVNLPSNSTDIDKNFARQETDRNPTWLDASFTLTFSDNNGPLLDACSDGSVQVIGLLPQQTVSSLKNQVAADIATSATDVAGALASFYPGGNSLAGATKATNVLFQDIFPPQPVAYEYSNLSDNCNFGWYFRPNTNPSAGAGGAASILGLQTGIVLLKTTKNITRIEVNGRTLSAWNKPPTTSSKSLYVGYDKHIGTIRLPDPGNIDFDNITSLAMFPALIPKPTAMKILHIDKDADFLACAKANNLVGTNSAYDYITNASLAAFLALTPKTPTPPDPAKPPAPAGDGTAKPPAKPTTPLPSKPKTPKP